MNFSKIILASKSPRRSQILGWAEVPYKIITCETEEIFPPELTPAEAAVFIAAEKAKAVMDKIKLSSSEDEHPVLAADTIVVINDLILGKPADNAEARDMLGKLSGNIHSVITGVCILYNGQTVQFYEVTEVEFNVLSPDAIGHYIERYQPFDKAGAYAIQEWIGVIGIRSIQGDFYNVMGLPVNRVVQELAKLQNQR